MIPGSANPLLLKSAAAAAGGYQVSRSLRFNSADSAYLSRTPAVAGNRRTWTWAGWVKRSALSAYQRLFSNATSSNSRGFYFDITPSDTFNIYDFPGGPSLDWEITTSQVFRDVSAWYHILLAFDTTQATAANRVKLYINGVQVTTFSTATYPSQNYEGYWNSLVSGNELHAIGRTGSSAGAYFNGYLADIHFIDGQALTPSSFTEVSATTGQLIPKTYSGSYGLVADSTGALPIFNTTGAQGAVKDTGTRTDSNSASIVLALPMDGTNGGTSFGDQSAVIRGSGSAKTVTVTGNTNTSTTQSKFYGSSGYFDGTGDRLSLAGAADFNFGTADFTVESYFYLSSFSNSYYVLGGTWISGSSSDEWLIQIENTGSIRFLTTLGTSFLSAGISIGSWHHFAAVRNGTTVTVYINGTSIGSYTNGNTLGSSSSTVYVGTQNGGTWDWNGYIQDFRIYKGVAKYTSNFIVPTPNSFKLNFSDNSSNTAATLGKDTSGNGNNWTPNNLSITAGAGNDSLVDSPTSYGTDTGVGGEVRGNYATLNPLDTSLTTLSNGNLDAVSTGGVGGISKGTFALSSGKWYWEVTNNNGNTSIGIALASVAPTISYLGIGQTWSYYTVNGNIYTNGTSYSYGATYGAGAVIGIALDLDNDTLTFYKNGVSQGVAATGLTGTYTPACGNDQASVSYTFNFGQRAFAYPVSGYKALVDTNLGAPLVAKPNTLFDVVKYDGTGAAQTITGLAFNPDFLWIKNRNFSGYNHHLTDAVRGVTKRLKSNTTGSELTSTDQVTAYNSNGFSLGADSAGPGDLEVNQNTGTYVAWAWDAGTSTDPSNQAGSITSQVRANVSAGFSVVTYTGTGANATVGHGLGVAPGLIIVKQRSTAASNGNWAVQHQSLGATKNLILNSTAAADGPDAGYWNSTSPTSSVFSVGTYEVTNRSTATYVAYCFAPVVGYSSFGSYTGNGLADGPFVYTGFRPRWVMIKRTDAGGENWRIVDTVRGPYNVFGVEELYPNSSAAENSPGTVNFIDALSNGFKLRNTSSGVNASGGTYIYAAFAESPFQFSRAR